LIVIWCVSVVSVLLLYVWFGFGLLFILVCLGWFADTVVYGCLPGFVVCVLIRVLFFVVSNADWCLLICFRLCF